MWVDENEMVETLALRQHRSRQRPTLQGGSIEALHLKCGHGSDDDEDK